jgi:transcriptional regulator with XRE-family HTH domain
VIAETSELLPARARAAAGLTIEQAAKHARIGPDYLRRIERHGGAPYPLACRLASLYRSRGVSAARIDLFLRQQKPTRKEA